MKIISIRSQILAVADRWRLQYPKGVCNAEKEAIWKKLRALDKATATAADVAAIIGNNSWACPTQCDECEESFDTVIEVGQEPDYESRTATLCIDCLSTAVDTLRASDY
jgi:hypothetical protein